MGDPPSAGVECVTEAKLLEVSTRPARQADMRLCARTHTYARVCARASQGLQQMRCFQATQGLAPLLQCIFTQPQPRHPPGTACENLRGPWGNSVSRAHRRCSPSAVMACVLGGRGLEVVGPSRRTNKSWRKREGVKKCVEKYGQSEGGCATEAMHTTPHVTVLHQMPPGMST
eukprot:1051182-Pelagomonas_calceolata.AAC.3